jgi:hypothetical protein
MFALVVKPHFTVCISAGISEKPHHLSFLKVTLEARQRTKKLQTISICQAEKKATGLVVETVAKFTEVKYFCVHVKSVCLVI